MKRDAVDTIETNSQKKEQKSKTHSGQINLVWTKVEHKGIDANASSLSIYIQS